MMGKGRYRRFSWVFLLAAMPLVGACSSGPVVASETPPVIPFSTRISPDQVPDGSLLLLEFGSPPGVAGAPVVRFLGSEVPAIPGGAGTYISLLAVPFGQASGQYEAEVRFGQGDALRAVGIPISVVDGAYPSEILRVGDRHVKLSSRDLRRSHRERREVGRVYSASQRKKFWEGPFLLPVEGPVTSQFGTKRIFNGEMQSFHQGLDLKAKVGAPVRAPAAGKVALAKDLFFTGYTVILDHGFGLFTVYAHLSRLAVKKGRQVKAGQLLGKTGMTGRASGPHLHWGAVLQRSKVNPMDLVKVLR